MLSNWIHKHPVRTTVYAGLFFVAVTFPMWLATVWPLFSDRVFIDVVSESKWWAFMSGPVYGWMTALLGLAIFCLFIVILMRHRPRPSPPASSPQQNVKGLQVVVGDVPTTAKQDGNRVEPDDSVVRLAKRVADLKKRDPGPEPHELDGALANLRAAEARDAIAAQALSPAMRGLRDLIDPPAIIFKSDIPAPGFTMKDLTTRHINVNATLRANNGGLLLILTSKELAPLEVTVRLVSLRAIKNGHAVVIREAADIPPHDFDKVRLFHDDPHTIPFIDGSGDALRTLGQSGGKFTLRQRGVYTVRLEIGNDLEHTDMDVCFEWAQKESPHPRECHSANSTGALVAEVFREFRS